MSLTRPSCVTKVRERGGTPFDEVMASLQQKTPLFIQRGVFCFIYLQSLF